MCSSRVSENLSNLTLSLLNTSTSFLMLSRTYCQALLWPSRTHSLRYCSGKKKELAIFNAVSFFVVAAACSNLWSSPIVLTFVVCNVVPLRASGLHALQARRLAGTVDVLVVLLTKNAQAHPSKVYRRRNWSCPRQSKRDSKALYDSGIMHSTDHGHHPTNIVWFPFFSNKTHSNMVDDMVLS